MKFNFFSGVWQLYLKGEVLIRREIDLIQTVKYYLLLYGRLMTEGTLVQLRRVNGSQVKQ